MAFQKGEPRHPAAGRKKGSLNKKKVARVSDYLADNNLNPTAEIVKLIPSMSEQEQIATWFELLSYSQAKPKPETEDSKSPEEGGEDLTLNDILDMVDVTPLPIEHDRSKGGDE